MKYLLALFGLALLPVAADTQTPTEEKGVMTARGTFEVKLTPQPPEPAGGPFGRLFLDKQFRGDLDATSKGQMLGAETAVEGSAGYVALELISGTLHGRRGSFILQHAGHMAGGVMSMTATVVPNSGTGELAGLSGRLIITIAGGKHSYAFEYALDAGQEDTVRVTRKNDSEIEVAGTFAVSRQVLFEAITRPEHLTHWMSAGGMALAEAHVDGRAGGSFRYVFQRPSGKKIEVRGAYSAFDPPSGFAYIETYDFSPLRIEVTTALKEAGDKTRLTQTLRYASTRERDEDFDGVATSSREAYAKLARYLRAR